MKNAISVVRKTPRRVCLPSFLLRVSGLSIHRTIPTILMPTAASRMAGLNWWPIQAPTIPARAWFASVAQSTPARIGHGRRKRVASNRDNNWVRSPISASATVEIETKKASIEGLQAERVTDHGGTSAARAGGSTVGLAMPEGPVRHGLRQVC